MAAIVWQDVVDLSASAAQASAGKQSKILDYVNQTLSVRIFGGEDAPKTKLARSLLAAHLDTVMSPIAAILTGQSEGKLSQTYTIPPIPIGYDPFWTRSGFGLSYFFMLNSSALARMPVVSGNDWGC